MIKLNTFIEIKLEFGVSLDMSLDPLPVCTYEPDLGIMRPKISCSASVKAFTIAIYASALAYLARDLYNGHIATGSLRPSIDNTHFISLN